MNRLLKAFLALLSITLLLTACHKKEDPNTVTVGIIDGPDAIIWQAAQTVAMKKFGLTIKLVTFSDYNTPNEALNDGDIDANAFQHMPFLNAQIAAEHYDIVPVANTFIYPIALYSVKIKHVYEIKKGDKIAIPSDPSNENRALLLLQQGGLIKLNEKNGVNATVTDIVQNPRGINIVEMDAAMLPRALSDVTAAVINNDFAQTAGLRASKQGILVENTKSPYMNIIAIKSGHQNDVKIKELIQSFQSPEVKAAAEKLYGKDAIAGW